MHRPIGMVDSDVGGLRVMAEMGRQLPAEDLVYLADTARGPYGSRSVSEVRRWTEECAYFLLRFDPKLMVVTSHTMGAVAWEHLSKKLKVPLFARPALLVTAGVAASRSGRVALLASETALVAGSFQRLFAEAGVEMVACSTTELTEALGEGDGGTTASVRSLVERALAPVRDRGRGGVGAVALGEARLTLLRPLLQQVLGPSVRLVDETEELVREVSHLLSMAHLARPSGGSGARHFFVSGDVERFRRLGRRFFGGPLGRVDVASPQRFFEQLSSSRGS